MANVRHQVGIVGDITKIFRALHEPDGLDRWWASRTETASEEEEQILNLHFLDVVTLSFRVTHFEKDALLRLHCISGPGPWQDSTLTFSVTQDPDQVWVGLLHENEAASEDDFLYFSTKWVCYLLSLRDYIETGKGRPYPQDIKIHYGD